MRTESAAMDIRRIEEFLLHEAHLLDDRRFEEWMDLFAEDGFYWAPASIDQADPLNSVSLVYDDREAMRTRVLRLRHPRIHVQTPPSRTARLVTNAFVEEREADGESCVVRSKFIIYEYRPSIPEALERVFGGTYRHRLVAEGTGFKIAWKMALLANCDARLGAFAVYF
jgi:3-phenylpropionate/cinnamic acid dioxygenase small subunit